MLVLSFVIIEGLIIKHACLDDEAETDFLVVLGAGLFGDEPSPSLKFRLIAAVEYAKEYPELPIVVSGGQGVDELMSEAKAMRIFLIERGIDPDRIILEDASTNTWENLVFTREVLEGGGPLEGPKILIVTSEYHMFRSLILAKRSGFEPYGKTAPTPAYPKTLRPYLYFREYFALIKSLVLDRP